tara:strand:+ start:166366 stop:166851 length:486 start_codon:yes stop_codon:yes gene_type:complete
MKKTILLLLVMLMSVVAFSQTDVTEVTETESIDWWNPYVAVGLSITDSNDFKASSYVSAEFGTTVENFSIGAVVGRNNLVDFGEDESLNGYWYELKFAASVPLGFVNGYGLVGVGSYFDGGGTFLEYGVGISRGFGPVDVFVQVASWDGTTYVTPGVSVSL